MIDRVREEWDADFDKLERAQKVRETQTEEADEYEDDEEEELTVMEALESASELIKKTAILLEFLSDPDFCKSLTKRDRELAAKQAERLWEHAEVLETVSDEEEEEDE